MIFYLNKGLILEQIIVQAMQAYFETLGVSVHITNKHPFARLHLDDAPGASIDTSFPAIVAGTQDDSTLADIEELAKTDSAAFTPEDLNPSPDSGKSPLEARGYMLLTPEKLDALRAAVTEKGRLYGVSCFIRRRDKIAIEIWAQNIPLKNDLYEHVRLFIGGWMRESLEKTHEASGLNIHENTMHGQRSSNFNTDFGAELFGALITFEADYIIEQTVIDTDLADGKIDVMDVINHAKGETETSQSNIFDYSADRIGG